MSLFAFLSLLEIGVALIVIFRSSSEKTSQYLSVVAIGLAALMLLQQNDYISLSSSWHVDILFPAAIAFLSLVMIVRSAERALPLLLLTASGLQLLVSLRVLDRLQP